MNTNLCDKCETVKHCMANGCIPLTVIDHKIVKQIHGHHRIIDVELVLNDEDGKIVEVRMKK